LTSPIAEATEKDRARFYHGRSMLGTFRPGDYLTLESVAFDSIRPGDVVVFRGVNQEGEPDQIVHRVVAIQLDGLVTWGDNNPWADTDLVLEEDLLGRVVRFERDGRTRPVHGGRWGLMHFRTLRTRHRLRWRSRRLIVSVGRWPYRLLRSSGLVPRLWQPSITTVYLTTEDGPVVKYVCGGRTVARWWPEANRFRCRKPYDLIIARPEKP